MKDIMLFWMQWSWKWTQWKLMVQSYWYKMFETWSELRKIRESWTELWNKIKSIIDSWNLVDTSIVMEVIENFLNNVWSWDKILFDWIPRSMEQFFFFEKVMLKFSRKPVWINIALTKDEALERLSKRFVCLWVDMTNNPLMTEEECISLWWKVIKRDDDNELSILKRINIFLNETQPVIDEYKKYWRMFEINWIQSVDNVSRDIERILNTI